MEFADLAARLEQSPFAQNLGITLEHAEPGYARLRMPVRRHHMQAQGAVQGGILAVLADCAMYHALRPMLLDEENTVTVELKVNYLSAARAGETLIGESRIVQRGGRIAVGDMEVRDAATGRLVVKGLGTYIIQRREGGRGSDDKRNVDS